MKLCDFYEAVYDPEKTAQFRRKPVDSEGQGLYNEEYSDWITVEPYSLLASFVGMFAGGTELMGPTQIIDAPESHDGTIVELHGRKYLLTEIKDIKNNGE